MTMHLQRLITKLLLITLCNVQLSQIFYFFVIIFVAFSFTIVGVVQ